MLIEDVLTEFKRTHLEHIEDIILTNGYEGGKSVVEYFRGLLFTLKGTSSEAVSVLGTSTSVRILRELMREAMGRR